MAEVLPPILQPASPITMFSPRPSSADTFGSGPMSSHQQTPPRTQASRSSNTYNSTVGYRGASIAPTYAYATAPYSPQDGRILSAPGYGYPTTTVSAGNSLAVRHHGYPGSSSNSTISSASSSHSLLDPGSQYVSKDNRAITNNQVPSDLTQRGPVQIDLSIPEPDLSLPPAFDKVSKPSPDRYRRTAQRSPSSGAGSKSLQQSPSDRAATPSISDSGLTPQSSPSPAQVRSQRLTDTAQAGVGNAGDMQVSRQISSDQAKRYRRRSRSNLETPVPGTAVVAVPVYGSSRVTVVTTSVASNRSYKPPLRQHGGSSHERTRSVESLGSAPSSSTSSPHKQDDALIQPDASVGRQDLRSINTPFRSHPDANRRRTSPSPLTRSLNNTESMKPQPPLSSVNGPKSDIPPMSSQRTAAQQLAALNEKDSTKGVKSRLRRAFSFSSAAELRRGASAGNNLSVERVRLRKDRTDMGEAEEDAIVRKQEAGGIGNSIYTGQGGVFNGSTDNLSIQTTASSASVMLRKMGQGMKKGGRSLKGLFRPKSVVGVPSADIPAFEPSAAQISLVNAEAERENVMVNPNASEHTAGGTFLPKLEKSCTDAIGVSETQVDFAEAVMMRENIVGSENDRAEDLAAVKRGILKRTGNTSTNSSPRFGPIDALPTLRPSVEFPASHGGLTPNHRRTDSITLEGEDYFVSGVRLGSQGSKSFPNTPRGVRRINFNPRIQFYDVWSPMEYDRRGEVATCNRLTPMLAQQIKEELNTYKMEMEVHELSRVHTHFF